MAWRRSGSNAGICAAHAPESCRRARAAASASSPRRRRSAGLYEQPDPPKKSARAERGDRAPSVVTSPIPRRRRKTCTRSPSEVRSAPAGTSTNLPRARSCPLPRRRGREKARDGVEWRRPPPAVGSVAQCAIAAMCPYRSPARSTLFAASSPDDAARAPSAAAGAAPADLKQRVTNPAGFFALTIAPCRPSAPSG